MLLDVTHLPDHKLQRLTSFGFAFFFKVTLMRTKTVRTSESENYDKLQLAAGFLLL